MAEESSGQQVARWLRNHVGIRRGSLIPLKMIRSFYTLATPKKQTKTQTDAVSLSLSNEKKAPENKREKKV
ncbi:hypothetical protein ACSQ67_017316 [Phaseolus vulgaris]